MRPSESLFAANAGAVSNAINKNSHGFRSPCPRFGVAARSTAGTDMNKESSRSHAIFTVALERTKVERVGGLVKRNTIRSKFRLVDLAGSERAKRTGAKGDRLKESVNINQGLLR